MLGAAFAFLFLERVEMNADGLYRVVTSYLCAGFVIECGAVTMCAPILRRKLAYWKTIAVRIG